MVVRQEDWKDSGVIHHGKYEQAGYMIDRWICSCGWKSQPYLDGAEYAQDEWKRHVALQATTGDRVRSGRELLTTF